ncbi:MAG: acyltransferase family protein [Aeromonas veronii]
MWIEIFLMTFRLDINGLRAIAVLSVVLYHFNVNGFSGGFSGVDVFFVISGYLMTGIIFGRVEKNSFELFGFYMDRAKRIIPALSVLCFSVLVVGYLIILPSDYQIMAKHVLSSISFLSNIQYLSESNYFDVDAKSKWLLHTWSLSAEWQFYIIYPIIIVAIKNIFSIESVKRFVIVLCLLSLFASILLSHSYPSSSFYMLHTRAWEMLAGGIVYLYPLSLNAILSRVIKHIGLVIVIGCIFLLETTDVWPGYLALLPVIGACLVIAAKDSSSFITDNSASQFIGKISYSVYLWHWPIVVYLNHYNLMEGIYILVGLVLSIVFGYLSYVIVESKFRHVIHKRQTTGYVKGLIIIFLVMCISFVPSATVYFGDGVPSRYPFVTMTNERISNEQLRYERSQDAGKILHLVPKTGDEKILIIGDSFGIDLAYALYESGFKGDVSNFQKPAGCGNYGKTPADEMDANICKKSYDALVRYKDFDKYSKIFLHEALRVGNTIDFEKVILDLRSKTKATIYVYGPKVMYSKTPNEIIEIAMDEHQPSIDGINNVSKRFYIEQLMVWNDRYKEIVNGDKFKSLNIHYVDSISVQCGRLGDCNLISKDSNALLYFDQYHFTIDGARDFGFRLKAAHPEVFE